MTPKPDAATYLRSDVSRTVAGRDTAIPFYRQDPEHSMAPGYMSDGAYAEAVANMVVVCTDVVPIDTANETFYLAVRQNLPMAGLWWIGGRLRAGESEVDGIRRSLKRETGLDLPAERFAFVNNLRYNWSERQQEPQNVGSDNLCYMFSAELSPDELQRAAANLDPEEYHASAGLQEYGCVELEKLLVQGKLHPVIWDTYRLIFGS